MDTRCFTRIERAEEEGGVALYVKDTLKCSLNNSIQTGDDSESVWVDIHKGKGKLTLGVLYRPPNLSIYYYKKLAEREGANMSA